MFCIYNITNKITNKSYIGKTEYSIQKRWYEHCQRARNDKRPSHFHAAIRKYGIENWKIDIIEENIPKELVDFHEIFWIAFHNTYFSGYNSSTGGGGGRQSEESRKKLSMSRKGQPISDKLRKINSIRWSGKNNPWYGTKGYLYGKKGKDNPSFGKKHTKEFKRECSERFKGENNPNFGNKGDKSSVYNTIWINDGKQNKRIKKEKYLEEYSDWKEGMLLKHHSPTNLTILQ